LFIGNHQLIKMPFRHFILFEEKSSYDFSVYSCSGSGSSSDKNAT